MRTIMGDPNKPGTGLMGIVGSMWGDMGDWMEKEWEKQKGPMKQKIEQKTRQFFDGMWNRLQNWEPLPGIGPGATPGASNSTPSGVGGDAIDTAKAIVKAGMPKSSRDWAQYPSKLTEAQKKVAAARERSGQSGVGTHGVTDPLFDPDADNSELLRMIGAVGSTGYGAAVAPKTIKDGSTQNYE